MYNAACAACHATDGRGTTPTLLGFDTPVPDFTDCAFSTVEPDADWMAVAHDGGPGRGFDRRMPAFGDAMTDAELQLVLDHIRGFCRDPAWPRGELNMPRPLVTEKAFPENEAVVTTSVNATAPERSATNCSTNTVSAPERSTKSWFRCWRGKRQRADGAAGSATSRLR